MAVERRFLNQKVTVSNVRKDKLKLLVKTKKARGDKLKFK
jgi:hypothetical protein